MSNNTEKKSRMYRVPLWLKAGFFWFTFALCMALLLTQVYRRYTIKSLIVENTRAGEHVEKAPNFSLPQGPGGKVVKLADFRGEWIVINFWATWCPPCRIEMPSLETLAQHFEKQMKVIAISVDQDWKDVDKFFEGRKPPFILLHDASQEAAQAYRAMKFPETFVIDPAGEIVAQFSGPHDWFSKDIIAYFSNILPPLKKRD